MIYLFVNVILPSLRPKIWLYLGEDEENKLIMQFIYANKTLIVSILLILILQIKLWLRWRLRKLIMQFTYDIKYNDKSVYLTN